MVEAKPKVYKGITGSTLKLIACLSMLIDHIGAAILEPLMWRSPHWIVQQNFWGYEPEKLFWIYRVHRMIGRFAFPIYCFLLVEGFWHTKNRRKFALRLFIFALISEIPFDLAFQGQLLTLTYQNVFFTLFLGFIGIWTYDTLRRIYPRIWIVRWAAILVAMGMAYGMKTDYSWFGVGFIFIFYFFHGKDRMRNFLGGIACAWELPAPLAFIPIQLYNGQRGWNLKYVFYFFYPVHLLVLYGIGQILIKNL